MSQHRAALDIDIDTDTDTSTGTSTGKQPASATPEFGPGGYLPPRASRRARKIVLRAPMGMGWPIAALTAGLLVIGVGAVFLLSSGPPAPPYVSVATITEIVPGSAAERTVEGTALLLVRAGGRLGVLVSPGEGTVWCPESRALERGTDVWTLDGAPRSRGGTAGLAPVPSTVYEGELYVDTSVLPSGSAPTEPVPAAPIAPACTGGT